MEDSGAATEPSLLVTGAPGSQPCELPMPQTKVFRYRIWDINQQSLYLRNDQLVAGYLQGPNTALEEKIYWVPSRGFKQNKLPIVLGIQSGTRCLACSGTTQPELVLEDVNITAAAAQAGQAEPRWTFFRSYQDGAWRFEAAARPGWFLSTAAQPGQPLALAHPPDPARVLDFYFQGC
ncbi:interleukin-1 family member 10 [Alligator mississippiensis]|uniref:Interleukin-1 n=1 Tax=Alligator mississippiensis TaxID=8496 RepID=A0A151NV37_ALLMI|nr:interleukin-1 family member 10 [Alligator mississippiensis]KYO40285.1 interleukin 1 receptor antagonist [Alligator mississippiensis]